MELGPKEGIQHRADNVLGTPRPGMVASPMSKFTGPLIVEEFDVEKELWKLHEPLVFEVDYLGSGRTIEVPAGFVTDGATIPWPISIILVRWGRYRRAACVHDYGAERLEAGNPHPEMPSWSKAAEVFLQAMKASGVSWPVRTGMWAAVRAYDLYKGRG